MGAGCATLQVFAIETHGAPHNNFGHEGLRPGFMESGVHMLKPLEGVAAASSAPSILVDHSPLSQKDQDFPRHSLPLLVEVTRLPTGDVIAESPLAKLANISALMYHVRSSVRYPWNGMCSPHSVISQLFPSRTCIFCFTRFL